MPMLLKVVAIQIAWFGCLPIYMTASQQVFLPRPMNKTLSWSLFCTATIVSVALLSQVHHPLTASLYVLCVLMSAWIILALWAPYYPKAKVILPAGTLLMLGIGLLGVDHVG